MMLVDCNGIKERGFGEMMLTKAALDISKSSYLFSFVIGFFRRCRKVSTPLSFAPQARVCEDSLMGHIRSEKRIRYYFQSKDGVLSTSSSFAVKTE